MILLHDCEGNLFEPWSLWMWELYKWTFSITINKYFTKGLSLMRLGWGDII